MSAMSPHWCLETQDSSLTQVVRFAGRQVRLGEEHVRLADEYLFGPGQDTPGREVLLDLGNVACVASTALAGLLRLHGKLAASARPLHLKGVSPHIYELLELTELHRVLDVRRAESL